MVRVGSRLLDRALARNVRCGTAAHVADCRLLAEDHNLLDLILLILDGRPGAQAREILA